MLFNSYIFIFAFLPVVLGVFFLLGRLRPQFVIPWLCAASLFFYGWWDVRFVPLLLASIICNFLFGRWIGACRKHRAWLLCFAITANLLVLGYYKYAYFLTGQPTPAGWVLPLGISFFTFTQIAYLVDVAKGEAREGKWWHYLLFVTYFPHLIAGPILHHAQMMPQFADRAVLRPNLQHIALGLTIFAIGLAKKVLIADMLAGYVSPVFLAASQGGSPDFVESWTGALGYTLQLYFDFSGYSDMAIGLSLLFNIRLPQNFNSPYKATSIIEFWRRWHMTLAAFLRDYIYIPLGGNRRGPLRRSLNLMITMTLAGIWHGAGWTFLIWGALHGAYLLINHSWRALPKPQLANHRALQPFYLLLTFLCVVIAWVIFRADSMHSALAILRGMAGQNGVVLPQELAAFLPLPANLFGSAASLTQLALLQAWSFIAIGLAVAWCLPNLNRWMGNFRICTNEPPAPSFLAWRGSKWQAWLAGVLLGLSLLSLTRVSEFLYFQF